jgi:RNA polymerase sigma factor (sigma-70 family)
MERPAPSARTLLAASQGDAAAVRELLDDWAPVVLGWCKRLAGPRLDAGDVAQDVLIVLIDRVHTVQGPDQFRPWLFSVTRRTLATHRRSGWLHRWTGGLVGDPPARHDPHRDAEMSETGRRVQLALEAIAPAHREVLVLCDLEERSDSEAAEMLGIPKATVKSRLARARSAFRDAAARQGLGPVLASREVA